ncbi:uncharacterized protein LOC111372176 [Olea europaea var. sylvestris]|uniref:uncharacterized protein LOC111372176 n=1 Tax=Olea europaea var. sylvestris TaxID=158386 RepID=UPI000C1D605F|nr:uncharacterized protein LOC111372176 [Olea europaea var. sylvestris]
MLMTRQMVDKRSRLLLQYIVSPYTVEVKRRGFVDGTFSNLFCDVDPVRQKAFDDWFKSLKSKDSYTIGCMIVPNAKKWFEDVLTTLVWLADDHIDLAMELLRDRARRYPRSYDSPSRVILSSEFVRVVDIEHHELLSKGNEYVLSEYMLEWVIGLQRRCGKPWTDCTHVYIPVIANSHCFSVEIVFADFTMYVYDSDHSCLTQSQPEQILEPMAVIMPMMACYAMTRLNDRLAIVRNMTTTRQERS